VLALIDEVLAKGVRLNKACDVIGLPVRTIQRWRNQLDDRRNGPKTSPPNRLSDAERKRIVAIATSPEFRDLSPKQIVPLLADQGTYTASESSYYRVLREECLLHHREVTAAPTPRPRATHTATGPNQVWSWDITYLLNPVRGRFYYLYMIIDVWSRKIVGWEVHEEERSENASALFRRTCETNGIDPRGLVFHSDNGSPMKGSTLLATLQALGVVPSFSRPRVSDDNPYSEALFRTMKYRPGYPSKPFPDLAAARGWVAGFVAWYNHEHLHSGIGFVTPADRHAGRDVAVLENRRKVYAKAAKRHPERWPKAPRQWERPDIVHLNPPSREAAQA